MKTKFASRPKITNKVQKTTNPTHLCGHKPEHLSVRTVLDALQQSGLQRGGGAVRLLEHRGALPEGLLGRELFCNGRRTNVNDSVEIKPIQNRLTLTCETEQTFY